MSNSQTENDIEFDREKFAPVEAWCDEFFLHARLKSGVVLKVPLWWYPRLFKASLTQRNTVWLSPSGLHWEEIDEDVAIKGMVLGWKAPDAVPPVMDAAE